MSSLADTARRTLVVVGVLSLAFLVWCALWFGSSVVLLVFAGILLAVFFNGVARYLLRHVSMPYAAAVGLGMVATALVLVGLGFLVGPQIADQASTLGEQVPSTLSQLRQQAMNSEVFGPIAQRIPQPEEALSSIGGRVWGGVTGAFSSFVGAIVNMLIVLVVGIYLAVDPRLYLKGVMHVVPPRGRERAREVLHAEGRALRLWLVGRFSSMAVLGVLTTVGLLILGVPLALTLGLIAAILSFVPNIGPILSVLPALLVASQNGTQQVLYVLALYVGVQTVESYLITPLIQKKAVSIPPAMLLIVQVWMGVIFGILGLFLATPLAVAGTVLIQKIYVQDALHDDDVQVFGQSHDGPTRDEDGSDKGQEPTRLEEGASG